MLIVVGLGGNALAPPGEPLDAKLMQARAEDAAVSLAALARRGDLVVTHGNGPQVRQMAIDRAASGHPAPLDELDALTEGQLGYLIGQAIGNELPDRQVVSVLTRVVVDLEDPAFANPTKPVGPLLRDGAVSVPGWQIVSLGDGLSRRVVASPEPGEIVELAAIRVLLDAGHIVVCAGGGGIPVARGNDGRLRGVDAVIDKDLTTARLAIALGADALILLTDVVAVETDYRTPQARRIHKAGVGWLRGLGLPAGSMGPKVEAACRFAESTGRLAGIGRLDLAEQVLAGSSGTLVASGEFPTRWSDPEAS